MPQSKRSHAGVRAETTHARRADGATPARGSAVSSTVSTATTVREAPASRCEAALQRVLQQAGLLQPAAGTGAERTEALRLALQQLEPELALKIRALLVSGRDGQRVQPAPGTSASPADASSASAAFADWTLDADETGSRLIDYLRRGHAIACAMDIDVDSPIASWRSPLSPDLDERAWLSFGKQLAGGNPGDWQGFGVPEAAQGFSKIYLKLGDNAWWSFQATLDRPTHAGMAKERRALSKRRLKGVSVQTLEALAGQLGSGQGRALRRATRAIRARVGQLGPALASLSK